IRVAHPGVSMSQPEVRAGIPSVMGLWLFKECSGLPRAGELSLACGAVPAEELLAWSAVDAVVPPEEVLPETLARVRALAAKPRRAFAASKLNLARLTQADYEATVEAACRIQAEAFETGEPQRVAAAFLSAREARKR
ncbi:MAG: enoyl-CoA hydratase-related protein, partial [Alphaproteobacteria bacterium]